MEPALQRAYQTGHFWSPDVIKAGGVVITPASLQQLKPTDPMAVAALRSMSQSESVVYTDAVRTAHGREPDFDGEIGPAMTALVRTARCMVPDYAPPPGTAFAFGDADIQKVAERMQQNATQQATGSGNWPHCHNVGNFHAALVRVHLDGLPDFLAPMLRDVLTRVRNAYAALGLRFDFIDTTGINLTGSGNHLGEIVNIEMSFVPSSSGWIGLAIVGQNEGCQDNIWCRYLSTYRGGSSPAAIAQQWTTLIKHELGHNCGLDHSNGGVMNPSIVNGLAPEWSSDDPSTAKLKAKFGGVAVPTDSPPVPPVPPVPDDLAALSRRLDQMESNWLAQQGVNAYILQRLNERGN